MRHTEFSNVKDFFSYPGNVPIVPNNLDCASIVCNHISKVIHVQEKRVVSATSDIILCYTWTEKTKWYIIRVIHQIRTCLQKQGAPQLQRATPIGQTKVNPEITFYLQQPVEVQNKSGLYVPCRAPLDSGSESSVITEGCVQRLRLARTQTHASIQGISNVNTETHHSASVHLRSRHADWHTTLDCAILSNIRVPRHPPC